VFGTVSHTKTHAADYTEMEAPSPARSAAVFAKFGGLLIFTTHRLGFRVVLLRVLRFPPKKNSLFQLEKFKRKI